MKFFRWMLPFALISALLTGCSGVKNSQMEEALAFRTALLGAAGCSFSGNITADYGDRTYTFSVDCQGEPDGSLSFQVTAPETIAGITGTLSGDGGKLTFENTALDFGLLAEGQVSPISCPYVMLSAWRSGYISSAGNTEDGLQITFDTNFQEEALSVDLWLDGGAPKHGEISYGGRRILSVDIQNFQLLSNPGTN